MHNTIGVHNNINDKIQDPRLHLCLFGKLEGSIQIRRFSPEFTYPFFHMRGKFAMINTCDEFIDLLNLLGMYLTVAVCTCETYSRHCNQTFAELIPLFQSYHIVMDFPSLFLVFPNLLVTFGRCPLFAALLGFFFAIAHFLLRNGYRNAGSNSGCHKADRAKYGTSNYVPKHYRTPFCGVFP